eukprot:TRINITY_DN3495_c0_g1_i1.p1 TRINITY_DN3495_c0_g1~~TRINITY_DN3495_c0_g1_i1.p1  ORF type:complete len:442 (-),score=35.85 TRINITY_DN3495_c0_g1_i1:169-1386(-)
MVASWDDDQAAEDSAAARVGISWGRLVPLTLLPQEAGGESPACLDGTPYGFYFVPSQTNSTKWTISIDGGGWCYNEELCFSRSKTALGTSSMFSKSSGCACMNMNVDGTVDAECNCIRMPYCDGASFSGFRPKPWPVKSLENSVRGDVLYFRGIKNFDATMDFAFSHGLNAATEFVLTGGSAGGLSTFLHVDRIADRLARQAPKCSLVRAAPVVGYFLDHDNYRHDANNYTAFMKYIHSMQNLTFGSDGGLTAACQSLYPAKPHFCFMSPHMQQLIRTPFFMFNSKYDAWQLNNELQTKWTTPATRQAVLDYGDDFMTQFEPVRAEPRNGAFITSCICHGCPWTRLTWDGGTAYEHYADWYHGKTLWPATVHVDARLPNGNGSLSDPSCEPFSGILAHGGVSIIV